MLPTNSAAPAFVPSPAHLAGLAAYARVASGHLRGLALGRLRALRGHQMTADARLALASQILTDREAAAHTLDAMAEGWREGVDPALPCLFRADRAATPAAYAHTIRIAAESYGDDDDAADLLRRWAGELEEAAEDVAGAEAGAAA